jgi:tetratricopeptide (TPR) repeat protein
MATATLFRFRKSAERELLARVAAVEVEIAEPQSELQSGLVKRESDLPDQARCSFNEGLELLDTGEPRMAATSFEKALEIAPYCADAHVAVGIAYAMDSRIYPAIDHLEKAAEIEPDNFFAHFKMGQLCFKLRTPQKGYEALARALDCATSREEKRLVAQLLKEEKQREVNGIARPTLNRPFSRSGIYVAIAMGVAAIFMLLFHIG